MKVIKVILLAAFIFSVLTVSSFAQEKAQTVHSVRVLHHENEWYLNQIGLWEMELEKNPRNADAWYNYYKAHRYANFNDAKFPVDKIKKFNDILTDMEKHVPQSFEFALLKYIIIQCDMESKKNDFTWLEEAYKRDPGRTETYDEFINRYEIHEPDVKNLKKYCTLWYQSEALPSFLLDYNYNVLISADENSIIFTNGDNDTYPIWLLQQVKGIRRDVSVLNIHLIKGYPEYLIRKLKEKDIAIDKKKLPDSKSKTYLADLCVLLQSIKPGINVYCTLTTHHAYIESMKDKLFVTGLLNQYSPSGIDNFALLKRNILQRYRLDYLQYDWNNERHVSARMIAYLNANYVIPFMKLAEHLYLSGNAQEATRLKNLALNVALEANISELVDLVNKKSF